MSDKLDALKLAGIPIVERGVSWQADATRAMKEQAAEIGRLLELLQKAKGSVIYQCADWHSGGPYDLLNEIDAALTRAKNS